MSEKIRLLNVDVDNITMDELLANFHRGLLMTIHVDMIMKLQKDREFYEKLSQFAIITCDSQILYFASKLLGTPLKQRVSGSDFFPRFYMHYKDDPSITCFICGGRPGLAQTAGEKINAKVGRKMIVGAYSPSFSFDKDPEEIERMIAAVNDSGATVLVMGISAGRQEKFLVGYRDRFKNVRMFFPLGGTVDYESGALGRPPAWITNCGLEWFYRLVREPRQRWRRYCLHQPPVLWLLFLQRLGLYRNPFGNANVKAAQAKAPGVS